MWTFELRRLKARHNLTTDGSQQAGAARTEQVPTAERQVPNTKRCQAGLLACWLAGLLAAWPPGRLPVHSVVDRQLGGRAGIQQAGRQTAGHAAGQPGSQAGSQATSRGCVWACRLGGHPCRAGNSGLRSEILHGLARRSSARSCAASSRRRTSHGARTERQGGGGGGAKRGRVRRGACLGGGGEARDALV